MLRTTLASSRILRVCVLGLVTLTTAVIYTSDSAEARRYRQRHHARHHAAVASYSPQFASIIVDGNSGATLSSNNPDALRRPASLTKIMTLYLLFEQLERGKLKLDSELEVSSYASQQAPTKLGLKPGQTIKVEDAIKGLVTRSANDASVVIAEAIAGDEDEFAKLMTRKARALGMTKTVYRNANGLPNDEQLTTARDQATLGRAIQERFPRYYRYFATSVFNYRGQAIRNHNRLLGNVEGVDGIKTGYTRASGFNLVSSMRRGNRHLIGVVLGGRSGGSRDATMRTLLAENLDKGATIRTAAAITERNSAEASVEVAEVASTPRPTEAVQANNAATASEPSMAAMQATRSVAPAKPSLMAAAAAALPAPQPKPEQSKFAAQAKPEPAPLTSGVIQTQAISAIPGSAEPMKPVKVKTVQVKAGAMKLASAGPSQPVAPPITSAIAPVRPEVAETSSAVVARAEPRSEAIKPEVIRPEMARAELPPQPANHGTGHGVLGVLPASSVPSAPVQALAYVQPQTVQQNGAIKPAATVTHTGWIIQVGALESESEARTRLDQARNQARGLLGKADSFTEPVVAKDNRKLFRARFAGLERDQAEAVCKTLKRADISCITVRN
ncbi:SPOR domain-containing protein [Bradyrhizobium sp. AUGA SZCCT0177]|uniref:D-alanyl-D-alanine carboxypeptidase n=1 Tax=Bradyrhizobium sp. AUGA SZCCT0177 TaxID=2807665 RepID=UPI001BA995AE|nr:D-alanyl-D-alanine carboxypeptidase [Bradyrhizobium sp. AUGA SZCCT0177]MBR1284638.1 SPOR domain-containing protein [Bradyrhizobium sp. AUGA SZCCT0177]